MRIFQVLLQVAIWLFAFYVMAPEPYGWEVFKLEEMFRSEHIMGFLLYGFALNIILVYSYAHLALPPYSINKSIQYFFLINLLYLTGFTLLESYMDFSYQHYIYSKYPYDAPLTSYPGWVYTNLIVNALFLVGANLYGFSFAFIKEQNIRRRLEKEKLEAELSALKHQVNPHFLFNVLNSLYGLSLKNDDEETGNAIMQLSEMMRYMLYEANGDKVSLNKEIDYLKNYIELQRLRVNKDTKLQFIVEGEPGNKEIAPLIMIPFVENACKHGVSTVFPSEIDIFIEIGERNLFFMVKNPIHPRNGRLNEVGGIGLKNVHKRLELFYPQSHQLSINDDGKTYEVSLRLTL
ncbi:MAG: histidine kinase [Bacteroidia bacterium]|nr:histidine kinase [Bacteroidia bacterium]